MAIPNDLSFVTVMDVNLLDFGVLNGRTYSFTGTDTEHNLPFQNTPEPTNFTATVNGSTATVTTSDNSIELNGTDVVFDLETGEIDVDISVTDFTLTFEGLTSAELIAEMEDEVDGYIKPIGFLDSLTISNITEEGPRKEARGGKNARPVIRYGKTARLEMEDVVFNLNVWQAITKADLASDLTSITFNESFPSSFSLIGDTFVVDKATGERKNIYLIFYDFLPDGLFDITMESEGDIGVMSVAGELFASGGTNEDTFYVMVDKT